MKVVALNIASATFGSMVAGLMIAVDQPILAAINAFLAGACAMSAIMLFLRELEMTAAEEGGGNTTSPAATHTSGRT